MFFIRRETVFAIVVLCVTGALAKPLNPLSDDGDLAVSNQFPFMVSIRAENGFNSFDHVCGGSILSSKLILTAAHCTSSHGQNVNKYRIFIGVNSRFDGHPIELKQFITHSKYNASILENDLMFIELATPIEFSDVAQPIQINRNKLPEGVQVSSIGWKKTEVSFFIFFFPLLKSKTKRETEFHARKCEHFSIIYNEECQFLILEPRQNAQNA